MIPPPPESPLRARRGNETAAATPDALEPRLPEPGGAWTWDRRLVRLKLKQAFGRLMRRADDTGVFVLLDPMPSDFHFAFPPGVEMKRVVLAEAVREGGGYLGKG